MPLIVPPNIRHLVSGKVIRHGCVFPVLSEKNYRELLRLTGSMYHCYVDTGEGDLIKYTDFHKYNLAVFKEIGT
jgi:hypothetical protein